MNDFELIEMAAQRLNFLLENGACDGDAAMGRLRRSL